MEEIYGTVNMVEIENRVEDLKPVEQMNEDEILAELDILRQYLADVSYVIKRLRYVLETAEAKAYIDVSQRTNENGKPIYSNETARQKATILELGKGEYYVKMRSELIRLERLKDKITGRIATLKDALNVILTFANEKREEKKEEGFAW